MPKPEREFFVADSEDVVHTGDKEWERVLAHDPDTGDATKVNDSEGEPGHSPTSRSHPQILCYGPNYHQSDEPRVHGYWEEVLILEGRLFDRTLNRWIGPGEYACRPPGMLHGPYSTGDEGVKQFVNIRYPPAKPA
ncbi:hypothetical protein EHS25_004046 [Saitozyma podzolica]|uniref:ChrR-like cupin domain-containing protein n=1 Tax=Saitozyma podzolica TaxID=1890683 RepID=A0A427YSX7_9TREE|nr:hypothetical protein EHS25_004046 [Saitozyma podzolica]